MADKKIKQVQPKKEEKKVEISSKQSLFIKQQLRNKLHDEIADLPA